MLESDRSAILMCHLRAGSQARQNIRGMFFAVEPDDRRATPQALESTNILRYPFVDPASAYRLALFSTVSP